MLLSSRSPAFDSRFSQFFIKDFPGISPNYKTNVGKFRPYVSPFWHENHLKILHPLKVGNVSSLSSTAVVLLAALKKALAMMAETLERHWRTRLNPDSRHHHHYHHQSVLPKSRSLITNSGTKAAFLPKGRSSTSNSGTRIAVLLQMNRCGSFPLLSVPHSLFSIWTDLERSEKIPGAIIWRWGEWIWLTGPSGLHWNSPQGLNFSSIRVFDQIRDPEIPITLRPHILHTER